MAERTYSTTAAPQGYACRIGGVHVPWGATVRIDLDVLPEWDAAHKWVRRGWLVPVEEPESEPEFDRKAVLDELYQHAFGVMTDALTPVAPLPDQDATPAPDISDQMDISPDEWLASHTVAELRAMCSDRGIAYTGLRKAELVEAIMEHD